MEVYYVIGIGRSGTTLLTSLLNGHKNIATTPENYFVTFFYSAYRKKTHFSVKDLRMIHDFNLYFEKLQPYKGYTYDIDKVQTFIEKPFYGSYHELCIQFYSFFTHLTTSDQQVKSPTIIIDKNPSNTLYTKELLAINPNAKFILITRDYRANIFSRIESVHIRPKSILYNAIRWNYFMRRAIKTSNTFGSKVHELRYEDLVLNTQREIDLICNFLNIEHFDVKSAHEKERKTYALTENDNNDRFRKKYGDLSKPISQDRINAWLKGLSPEEIRAADYICGDIGTKWGYKPIDKKGTKEFTLKTYFLFWIKVNLELAKDRMVFFFPISLKLTRFKKFVTKIVEQRNR